MNITYKPNVNGYLPKPPPVLMTPWLILALFSHPAMDAQAAVERPSVATLQAQVADLQTRVSRLEQQLTNVLKVVQQDGGGSRSAAAPVRDIVTVKEQARIPQPSIQLGGRIKVDGIYNSRTEGAGSNRNQGDLSFVSGNVPLDGAGKRDQLNFSARETRIWVTAQVPTAAATLGAYVEADFYSADDSGNEKVSNSYVPRMRHAYVDYGGFTAGQTWRGGLYLALEQPESTLTTAAGTRVAADDEQLPDVVGKLEFTGAWGNWSLAGMVRQIRIDEPGTTRSSWGAAVSAAGRINIMAADNVRFALSYGNVLGRYLSLNAADDCVLDVSDDIRLSAMFGAYLSYQHWWSQTLRSSLTLGYSRADPGPVRVPGPVDINQSLFSSHLNLLWNLTSAATIGVEWIHGERRLEDGREGALDRVQLTSMFRF